ncbi:hypothetical protein, partial [uncultured Methylobacterium sp.]|uniref:hypothetical protein n=1 Tax=uncultured Methylobacterium sp. TaxID=157278 RepID=UPI002597799A
MDREASFDALSFAEPVSTSAESALELFPIAPQPGTALSHCFYALSFAEPVSTSAESALELFPIAPQPGTAL